MGSSKDIKLQKKNSKFKGAKGISDEQRYANVLFVHLLQETTEASTIKTHEQQRKPTQHRILGNACFAEEKQRSHTS